MGCVKVVEGICVGLGDECLVGVCGVFTVAEAVGVWRVTGDVAGAVEVFGVSWMVIGLVTYWAAQLTRRDN